MGLLIDASTPAALGRVSNATPYVTAAFSPPAGSLVFIAAGAGWSSPAASIGITCSDSSGGGNWERPAIANGGAHFPGAAAVFRKYFATAPGSITVSIAYTGFGSGNCEIVLPVVFWGAHPDQSTAGAASDNPGDTADAQFDVVTTKVGSQVWGVSVDEDSLQGWTPNANTLLAHEFTDAANGIAMKCWASAANTITPGATTFGGTWNASDESKSAALEIIPGPFPVAEAWASGRTTTSDTTSHPITLPPIVIGQKLVVVFSCDGAPTCSEASGLWNKVGQASNTTVVTGAVFEKIATGGDTLTITTTAPEQSSHVSARVANAGTVYATSANGSSTNSNPPSLTPAGGSNDYLWLATRSGDSTVVASAAPTNFGHLQTLAAAGTSGASTNVAERPFTGSVLDPGAFTSLTEQWVSWTIAIAPAPVGGPVALEGTVSAAGAATGALSTARGLAGFSSAAESATGALSTARGLAGFSSAAGSATGALVATRPLTGTSSAAGELAGSANVARPLAGSSSAVGELVASLTVTRPLSGSASVVCSVADAPLAVHRELAGNPAAVGEAGASLVALRPLAGAISAAGQSDAVLAVERSLVGDSAAAEAIDVAPLGVVRGLAGSSDGAAEGTATVTVLRPLGGDCSAVGNLDGALGVSRALVGSSAAVGEQTGHLSAARPLSATVLAQADAAGALARSAGLVGGITAAADASGDLIRAVSLAGISATVGEIDVMLVVDRPLAVAVVAAADSLAELGILRGLSGSADAAAELTGLLELAGQVDLIGTVAAAAELSATLSVVRLFAGDIDAVGDARSSGPSFERILTGSIEAVGELSASLLVTSPQAGPIAVPGTTLVAFKRALRDTLAARVGLAGVAVNYGKAAEDVAEAIWLGDAAAVLTIPTRRAGRQRVEESYDLAVTLAVRKTAGEGQKAADLRAVELFRELQQTLATTPRLIPVIQWATLVRWRHIASGTGGEESSRSSRFDTTVNVRARLSI